MGRGGRATVKFDIAFHGKGCHSAGPENGINALNALIMLFNCIDNLRPLLPTDANLNGVILDGGKACNVIPDYAHAQFSIRVRTQDDGDVVMGHLKRVIAGVEQITGARAEYTLERGYAERYPNDHIEREIQKALEEMGETVERAPLIGRYGSSDIGNVTLKMPAVHTYFKIAEEGDRQPHPGVCRRGGHRLRLWADDESRPGHGPGGAAAVHRWGLPPAGG